MFIFDLDGTLIDSSRGIISAIDFVIKKNGYVVYNNVGLEQFIGPPVKQQFMEACHLSDKEAELANNEFVNHYETYCLDLFQIYPNVKKTLKTLKENNHFISLATYKPINQTIPILQSCGLYDYFDYVSCGSKSGNKMKTELIMDCVNEYNLKNTNSTKMIYVGDTLGDYRAANLNKLSFIAVSYGFEENSFPENTIIIDDIAKILNIV